MAATRARAALDAALAGIAESLSRHTRGGDFVGRYSDEVFVIILPDEDLQRTHAAAARLRACAETVGVLAPAAAGTAAGALTLRFAVGVACAPQHGHTAAGLLTAAATTIERGSAERRAA